MSDDDILVVVAGERARIVCDHVPLSPLARQIATGLDPELDFAFVDWLRTSERRVVGLHISFVHEHSHKAFRNVEHELPKSSAVTFDPARCGITIRFAEGEWDGAASSDQALANPRFYQSETAGVGLILVERHTLDADDFSTFIDS